MIDWNLCLILMHKKMSYRSIAEKTGTCFESIRNIAEGRTNEPKFNNGIRIIDLAYDVLSEDDFVRIKIQGR